MKFRKISNLLSIVIALSMLLSIIPTAFASEAYEKFDDFPTDWSREAIEHAVDNGLLVGRSANTMNPKEKLTRAEMATIINRAFGATIKADISKYTDVTPNDWYYDEIAKAVNMRTFIGDSGTTMNPDEFITREAVFTVIARALVLETQDFSSLNPFPDVDKVSDWAKSSTAILVSKGYIHGNDEGLLCPKCYITREEFAQMMYNIIKTYYLTEGTFNHTGTDSSLIRTSGVTLENVTIDGDLILGDGVGNGTVVLKNVIINGRLLCRGGEGAVKLINTKVKEYVVVYDVNGTVHFENYRSESVFNNIKEITPATFLTPSGTGVTGGTHGPGGTVTTEYYTVSFHNSSSQDVFATAQVNKAAGEINRNLAAINKDLDVIYSAYTGATLPAYNRNSLGYNNLGTQYQHQVEKEYIYEKNPGVWEVFTNETTIDKDIDVYYAARRVAIEAEIPQLGMPYTLELRYDSRSRFADSLKDALITTGSTLSQNVVREKVNAKLAALYNRTGMINQDSDILDTIYGLKIPEIIESELIDGEMKYYVINKIKAGEFAAIDDVISAPAFIQALATASGQALSTKQDVIDYFGTFSYPADDTLLASRINSSLNNYDVYTDFKNEVLTQNVFTVNKATAPFAKAIGEAVYLFSADDIRQRLQAKGFGPIISLLGTAKFDEVFATSKNVYYRRLESIIDRVVNNNLTQAYTTSLNVNIPMILEGIYENYALKFKQKIENNRIYDYDQNTALQKLVNTDWFDMVIAKRAPGYAEASKDATGYYIRDYMDYYSLVLDTTILFDEALCYYNADRYDEAEFILIKKSLTKDLLRFLDKLQSLSDSINNNDAIIGSYTLQDLINKVDSLNNIADSAGGAAGSAIRTVVDKIKSILEDLGHGNLPAGYTLADLNVLAAKLETVINGMNESEYDLVNDEFNELISSAIDRIDSIIDELDQNGTIAGKPLADIFSSVSALNNFYNNYSQQIEDIISAVADADLGSIDVNVDLERLVNIIFGREDENNIFTIDSIIEAIKSKLGTVTKQGYDAGTGVYVIDQYSKTFGGARITLERKFY